MKRFAMAMLLGAVFCSVRAAGGESIAAGIVPAWWSIPFVALLASIAIVPFIHKRFWEKYYGCISIGLGMIVAVVYATQLGSVGREKLFETGLEYFKFIALVGSLFVVSGGILIDISGGGNPRVNALVLASGLVLANIVGTTGASVLLIRPFLRINKDRLRPFHVVLFIFIVSNSAGALTPLGPPLYLGYINGVPFEWTLVHCWAPWLLVNGLLLFVFCILDARAPKSKHHNPNTVIVSGWRSVACLGVLLIGVFLDRILELHVSPVFTRIPSGSILMLAAAFYAYRTTAPRIHTHNDFHFGPIKEVALLFAGIFATMMPALDYLAAHAANLGIDSPGGFYVTTGVLSSFLDNAPAYLDFLCAALGLKGLPLTPAGVREFSMKYPDFLRAISLGSVFFGGCTYIGNGPNFMVKAIAESAGARMPGFFAYILKYTLPILAPILVLVWFIFLR